MVDSWMVEMCSMLISLQVNGLGELCALQSYLSASTLGNPIVERAVTSHLQTSGCTIVMGNNTSEINSVSAFIYLSKWVFTYMYTKLSINKKLLYIV